MTRRVSPPTSRAARRLLTTFLGWQATVAAATSFVLLILPARFSSGPAMATVYGMAPRWVWGCVFLGLTVTSMGAFVRLDAWRYAVILLIAVHTAWAIGLTLPLFYATTTNLLTPLAWGSVSGSALIIVQHVGDERP